MVTSTPPPRPRDLNPTIEQPVEDVLLKALAREPSERYASAEDFVMALELAGRRGSSGHTRAGSRVRVPSKNSPTLGTPMPQQKPSTVRRRVIGPDPTSTASPAATPAASPEMTVMASPAQMQHATQAGVAAAQAAARVKTATTTTTTGGPTRRLWPAAIVAVVALLIVTIGIFVVSNRNTPELALVPLAVPANAGSPTTTGANSTTPGGPSGAILFSDALDDLAAGRLARSSPQPANFIVGYGSDGYLVQKVNPNFSQLMSVSVPGSFDDAALAVDAKMIDPTTNRFVVLTCRDQSTANSGYRLMVTPASGQVSISRVDGGTLAPLVSPVDAPSLLRTQEPNRIELRCVGASISARTNGAEVASVQDAAYRQGGLLIAAGADVGGPLTVEARVDLLQGTAEWRADSQSQWVPVTGSFDINPGAEVRTGPQGHANVSFTDGSRLTVDPSSQMGLDLFDTEGSPDAITTRLARVHLQNANLSFDIKPVPGASVFEFRTDDQVAVIRGTSGNISTQAAAAGQTNAGSLELVMTQGTALVGCVVQDASAGAPKVNILQAGLGQPVRASSGSCQAVSSMTDPGRATGLLDAYGVALAGPPDGITSVANGDLPGGIDKLTAAWGRVVPLPLVPTYASTSGLSLVDAARTLSNGTVLQILQPAVPPPGPQGPQGPLGPAGPSGPVGPSGPAGNISDIKRLDSLEVAGVVALGGIVSATGPIKATNGITVTGDQPLLIDDIGGIVAGTTGNTFVAGTFDVLKDVSVNKNKFTVSASNGNTAIAGTMDLANDLRINTDKFTVQASSGNTATLGTLDVAKDLRVAKDKFVVHADTGDTSVAGKLAVVSDFTVADKFKVEAASGNTTIAGTVVVDVQIADGKTFTQPCNGAFTTASGLNTLNGDVQIADGKTFTPTPSSKVRAGMQTGPISSCAHQIPSRARVIRSDGSSPNGRAQASHRL